jgi:NADH-quinone oxidoreductase subunit B
LLREFGMEEHPQGGFHGLLEVIPTKADYVLDLIRANSLWPLLSGLSCCAIEMMSTATSVNDIDRFGMFPFRASPRQADVLIVAGTLTTKMAGPLVRLWEQMPEPKWCVAMGTCTTSGGRFKRSYSVVQGVDRVMPVDVYVPGCPPRPEGLIYGMLKLHELVKQRRGEWGTYVDRGPQRMRWEGDVR